MDNNEPLAEITKTSTYKLTIYQETSDGDTDEFLVGVDDKEPSWVEVEYDSKGQPYIEYYGTTYLSEFINK